MTNSEVSSRSVMMADIPDAPHPTVTVRWCHPGRRLGRCYYGYDVVQRVKRRVRGLPSMHDVADDHPFQQLDRAAHAFHRRHRIVLVLDREHVVVADLGQQGDEVAPPALVMAVAEGDVVPGPV